MVRQSRHPSICIGTQSIDLGSCFRFRIHLALFRWVSAFALLFLALPCSAQLAKSGWPKFRGNAGNSGLSVGANVLPNEMWSKLIQQGGGIATSPAIGADGTVYVCGGGSVYSLGATGGGVNWSFTPPSGGTFQATPAIGIDGTVFIGSVNPNSSSGNTFYALDGLKGTVKWSFTGSPSSEGFVSSPAIGLDGTIYAATTMGHVYALNPSTGAVNWTTTTSSGEQFLSSPASDNNDQQHYGMIYVGSHSGNLYAISKLDGSISWTFTAGGAIDSSPAMGGAGVVVGSNDGNIYDITLAGTKFWSVATGSRVYSSPAIGPDGTIYVGSEDKNVYAITGMGTHLWTFTTGAAVDGSPAIGADGTIYIGPGDGYIYALNGATGARKWSFQTTSSSGSPSLGADGRLYVLSGTSMIGLESVHVTSLSVLPNTVLGGTSVQGSVVMNMSAPVGGAYIAVASDNGAASPPGSMIIAQGQNHIQFTVNTHGVDYDQTANISATPGINKSVPLKVLMATLKSFVLIPSTLNELDSAEARVTLNGPAGPLGVDVFGSSNTKFAIINPKKPPQAHIGYGSTTASFGVDTIPVDTQTLATINAYANGSMNAILTINPATLASVTVSPAAVAGGNTATGTINLNLPAGPSGTVVSLSSDNAAAQVPGTVTVPAGTTTTTFLITTTAVDNHTSAQITGTLRGVPQSTTLGINPVGLSSVSVNPATILGGKPAIGTVTLDGPAGVAGVTVALTCDNSVAQVQASVIVSPGQTTGTFAVTTVIVSSQTIATISASYGGQTATTKLTVDPATPASVVLSPSAVLGGNPSTGTVTLDGTAGSQGVVIALTSSSPSAVVPPSLAIPAGKNSGTFPITTTGVNTGTNATITASLVGISQSAVLSITPTALTSFTLDPLTVVGGQSTTGTLTLLGAAEPTGTTVTITSASGIAVVPATVLIPPGQKVGTFTVATNGVTSQTYVAITANMNGQFQQTLTVNSPSLLSVSMNPATVSGATPSTGTVSLNGEAGPAGVVVSLTSNSKKAVVPANVSIQPGQSSANFTVSTTAVSAQTIAKITGELLRATVSGNLTIVPIGVLSLSISPDNVSGGTPSAGTVTLTGIAPPGGTIVHLTSSTPSAAAPAASIVVPASSRTANFTIKTFGVASQKVVTITAKVGTSSQSASLTLTPPVLLSIGLNPATVTGGLSSTGTVTLSGFAPAGGLRVALSSNSGSANPPSSVTIPAGKVSVAFTVKTTGVSTQTSASVNASVNGVSVSATLTINPSGLASLTLSPSKVVGGKSSTGTVTLSGPAPTGGAMITLTSDQSFATTPASVTVPAGKTSATFSIQTTKAGSKSSATISAGLSGQSKAATLTIT